MLAYLKRAVNRAVSRGPVDTALYSFRVARSALAGAFIDLRYGGAISRDHLHINDDIVGCNAVMHTEWKVLRAIFHHVPIGPDDVLVDIGCGSGRVLNFWLSCRLKNKMIGVEINEAIARSTAERYARYPNIKIVRADATDTNIEGTIFYLYNPFHGEPLRRFAESMRDRPGRIVFYNFGDLAPFSDRRIEIIESTRDDLQYRVAIIS